MNSGLLLRFLFIISATFINRISFSQKVIFEGNNPGFTVLSVDDETFIVYVNGESTAMVPRNWMKKIIRVSSPGLDPEFIIDPLSWNGGIVRINVPAPAFIFNTFDLVATRLSAPLSSLASQITTITNPTRLNPMNMAELFERSGDLFVQRSQLGGGSPVIRGFEANKVLLVVDGVRMNNLIFRGGHLQNALRLDANAVESVEIINGPGSQVYGSDALGGVISVNTARPVLSTNDSMEVKGGGLYRISSGNFKYFDQEKALNTWFNIGFKRWAVRTAISLNRYGDLRQGAQGGSDLWLAKEFVRSEVGNDTVITNADPLLQRRSEYGQIDLNQKWLFTGKREDSSVHILNFQYSLSSDINRYDRLSERGKDTLPKFSEWYYGPESRFLASYRIDFIAGKKLYSNGRIIAAFQQFEESRNTRDFGDDFLVSRNESVDMYTLNADWNKVISRFSMYYGFEGFYNSVGSKASSKNSLTGEAVPASTRYPAGGSDVFSAAPYLTSQYRAGCNIVFTAGVRYTWSQLNADFGDQLFYPFPFKIAEQKNSDFSSQAGVVFQSNNKNFKARAQWAEGFRSPNADDLAKVFDSRVGTLVIPNPSLKSERSQTSEIGIDYTRSNSVSIHLTVYNTRLFNAIVIDHAQLNGLDSVLYDGELSEVRSATNRTKATINGLSFGAKWRFLPRFELNGSANYTKGRQVSGDTILPLDHIPPFFGRLGLTYEFKTWNLEGWTLMNAAKPIKEYYLDGEDNIQYATPEGMPAWQTINLSVKRNFGKNISIQLACENLLDVRYRTFSSGISSPGRLIRLSARFNL